MAHARTTAAAQSSRSQQLHHHVLQQQHQQYQQQEEQLFRQQLSLLDQLYTEAFISSDKEIFRDQIKDLRYICNTRISHNYDDHKNGNNESSTVLLTVSNMRDIWQLAIDQDIMQKYVTSNNFSIIYNPSKYILIYV